MSDSKITFKPTLKPLALIGAMALFLVAPLGFQAHAADPLEPGAPQCVVDPDNEVTCTGDLSAGIYIDGTDYDTLNLSDAVEHDGEDGPVHIKPERSYEGIYFNNQTEDAHIQIIGDSDGINMEVDEPEEAAIAVIANQESSKVSLQYWGDIKTQKGQGINIRAAEVVVEYYGDIETIFDGNGIGTGLRIQGQADADRENRRLYVKHVGDISTIGPNDLGIVVVGHDANHIEIEHSGEIVVEGLQSTGIWAAAGYQYGGFGGNIKIVNKGRIEATSQAIEAYSSGPGALFIEVDQTGDIEVRTEAGSSYPLKGIYLVRVGGGNAEMRVWYTGALTVVGANRSAYGIHLEDVGTKSNSSVSLGEARMGPDNVLMSGASISATSEQHDGYGVYFDEDSVSPDNALNTYNEVTISGSTFDVLGKGGNETITNYGTLTMPGDTDLGEGVNAFNNEGLFNSGRTLNLGADANLFTNSGIVSIFGDDTMNRTVLTGSWVGQPNSRLRIDAVLNDGVSDVTDVLAVSGDTSGTTLVYVVNQGGTGGLTGDGPTDGIKITEIGGESNGDFELGEQVFAGLAEYELVKADGQDWYLQSILVGEDPEEILNSINDSAISSAQIPRSLQTFGSALTGSRKDRLNGQKSSKTGNTYGLALDKTKIPGSWARIVGGRGDADGRVNDGIVRGGVFGADTSHEETFWALQGGFTAFTADDRLTGSAFLHYGAIDIDHTNKTRNRSAGSTDMTAWGGGISVTWLDPRGFYLDGVATLTSYEIDMTDSNSDETDTDARGWSLSSEIGIQLDPIREITMTPQLQLTYQAISIDNHADAGGNRIAYDDEDSLELRVGSTFEVAIDDTISLYSQLNILHQFLDASTVVFGSDGVPVSMDRDDTSYEARIGVTLRPQGAPYSGYVEAQYRAPFGGGGDSGDTESWSATGGLSYRF